MTYTDRHIVEAYSSLLEALNTSSKIELIERLSKSVRAEDTEKDNSFYRSFGAFSGEKSAEEIINEIKLSRKFRNKDTQL